MAGPYFVAVRKVFLCLEFQQLTTISGDGHFCPVGRLLGFTEVSINL